MILLAAAFYLERSLNECITGAKECRTGAKNNCLREFGLHGCQQFAGMRHL
jgi:hypothetical protein